MGMPAKEVATARFAAKLLELRKAKRWTQEQCGKETGVPATTIANIEQQVGTPNWYTALRLAYAFGVNVSVFAPAGMPDGTDCDMKLEEAARSLAAQAGLEVKKRRRPSSSP